MNKTELTQELENVKAQNLKYAELGAPEGIRQRLEEAEDIRASVRFIKKILEDVRA